MAPAISRPEAFHSDHQCDAKASTVVGTPVHRVSRCVWTIQRLNPALTSNNAGLKQAIGSIKRDSIDIFTAARPAFEFWQPLLDFPCVKSHFCYSFERTISCPIRFDETSAGR